MKKEFILSLLLCVAGALAAQKSVPAATIKTMEGQSLNTQDLGKSGKITVVSFWATWCSPCKKELDAIKDYYEEWQQKYGVELVAVSIDDARTAAKVPAMVAEKGWLYRILLDSNKAFHQAVNATSVPHTLLIDQNGNIVFEHVGYTPGDELELEEQIKALMK